MNPEGPAKQQLVCAEAQAGPSSWEEFTPDVSESRSASYRFRCPHSGSFHCTLTGLVFVVDQKAELQYNINQWNEDLVGSAGRSPAGPLFRIECPENAICKLHLPHCETKHGQRPGNLSVAQIADDGMSFIGPLEITDTHVVINVLHLSAFGLVSPFQQWFTSKSARGQVLLFIAPPNLKTKQQKLNVLLLPCNIPVDEVQRKQWNAKRYIKAPTDCELIQSQSYRVACPNACIIQPEKATFTLSFGPNYHPTFEIRLPMSMQRVTLTLKDQKNKEIWKNEVHLTDPAVSEDSQPRSQQNVSLEDESFSDLD
ncbi:NACHT, LRR and PYD domains-containing protein 1b allele 5-like [Sphaeramia orbicularis]|uniref:NACHT, LRR and PYD domains-containing protein 1b allele 5-like n=1 Tax=Sphaeramia orbicularis TaxID=375764 RepID=A0A672ZBK9_9TELE|nr:NACHT, LRR and PYD domains-containing protein 1b allele 5-like [Sphaeramia orbicularis]